MRYFKIRPLAAFAVLLFLPQLLVAQYGPFLCKSDTIYNLNWEPIGAPPAYVGEYAQSKGRLFAATTAGLFYSDNAGLRWQMIPGTFGKQIVSVTATDSVVFYQSTRPVYGNFNTTASSLLESFEVFASYDLGQTFVKIIDEEGGTVPDFGGSFLYNNTPIQHLGAGAFSFRHSLPGSSNGLDYEKFYFSFDYGRSWSVLAGGDDLSRLSFCTDTLLNMTYFFGQNGFPVSVINLYANNNIQIPVLSDTLFDTNVYLRKSVYFNGDLYTFWPLNDTQIQLKTYRGVGQSGFPQQIDTSVISFQGLEAGENIVVAKTWNLDTVLGFQSSQGRVYTASINQPTQTVFVQKAVPGATSLPAGMYRCDFFGQTLYSGDEGQNWEPRFQGLHLRVDTYLQFCGRAYSKNGENGRYFFKNDANEWEMLETIDGANITAMLGQAFGELYVQTDNGIYHLGADCDVSQSNQVTQLTTGIKKVLQFGGAAYAVGDYSNQIWQNNGNGWSPLVTGFYGNVADMHRSHDTLLLLLSDAVLFSVDGGVSWQKRVFPFAQNQVLFWQRGFELFAYQTMGNPASSYTFLACQDFSRADEPGQWEQQCVLSAPYHSYFDQVNFKHPPELFIGPEGLLFYHVQQGLYVSKNNGKAWLRLAQLPFKNHYTFTQHAHGGYFSEAAFEGALNYAVADGQLYACSQRLGILRTPLAPIQQALDSLSVNTTIGATKSTPLLLTPNPSEGRLVLPLETLLEGFVDLQILDMSGRMVFTEQNVSTGRPVVFQLGQLPAGMYIVLLKDVDGRNIRQGKWILKE
jgi:hypothetical protein